MKIKYLNILPPKGDTTLHKTYKGKNELIDKIGDLELELDVEKILYEICKVAKNPNKTGETFEVIALRIAKAIAEACPIRVKGAENGQKR